MNDKSPPKTEAADPKLAVLLGGRRWVLLAATATLGVSAGNIAQMALIGRLVDAVAAGAVAAGGPAAWGSFAWQMALIVVARALLSYFARVFSGKAGSWVRLKLRPAIYDKILRLGPAWLAGQRTGQVVHLGTDNLDALETYYSLFLPQFVVGLTAPLLVCGYIASLHRPTGLILLAVVPLVPALLSLVAKRFRGVSQRYFARAAKLSELYLDALIGLPTLALLNAAPAYSERIRARSEELRRETMALLATSQQTLFWVDWTFALGTTILTAALAYLRFRAGILTIGQSFTVLLLGVELARPLTLLGAFFFAGAMGRAALRRVQALLNLPVPAPASAKPDDPDDPKHHRPPDPTVPEVEFRDVVVAYPPSADSGDPPDEAPRFALRGVSFAIRRGERVALVGPSGAGKSTVANVLLRFVEPHTGVVRLRGRDLASLAPDWVRGQIGLVPQRPHLFYGSLRYNLLAARPDASEADLQAAARGAQLSDFVDSLPAGYDTPVGERGLMLSAGQGQRLAIARCLLRRNRLLILDEPTAQLDAANESAIKDVVAALPSDYTVIVIAHRLSTLRWCDRALVLDQGRLIEQGSHAELAAAGGFYARLAATADGS